MDSLKELLGAAGPHMPFMMAAAPGKVKMNGTRIAEIFLVLAFLWYQFGDLKSEMKEIQKSNHDTIIEFKEDKAKTEQRLGRLEETVNKIEEVVFKPIRGYREVDPDKIKMD